MDWTPIPQPTQPARTTAFADQRLYTPLFPNSTRRQLVYHEEELLVTSTSGIPNQYFFTANGLFDPNVTGTGHQPIGFDQMMLMYEQYTVLKSKITLHVICSNATAFGRAALFLSPDTTVLTDSNRIVENGQIVSAILSPNTTLGAYAELNLSCDIANYFGRSQTLRELLQDDELFGNAATNPSEQVYYSIGGWDPFGTNTLGFFFNVTIQYDVVFWERRKLIES
jgi:hypothetical protein